ncbi:hypothetical protein HanRHA438_Chr17g0833531 [Helianthus annuus]|nr:hypothetical protein HanRHA438_Chr17g0833531 [Helianthus annuus]
MLPKLEGILPWRLGFATSAKCSKDDKELFSKRDEERENGVTLKQLNRERVLRYGSFIKPLEDKVAVGLQGGVRISVPM